MRTTRRLIELASHTYTLQGRELSFWSLAPEFKTHFAVGKIQDHPRSFVWLYDSAARTFVHACVCWRAPYVLAVKNERPVSVAAA